MGTPCVVGASDLVIDRRRRTITGPGGRTLGDGDIITVGAVSLRFEAS